MKKKIRITNGVELMQQLFAFVCNTASQRKIFRDGKTLIVELLSGPNDGQAATLTYSSNLVSVAFFHSIHAAKIEERCDEAYMTLNFAAKNTGPHDGIKGCDLCEQVFTNTHRFDLIHLHSRGRSKGIRFLIRFLELIDELPSEHAWQNEIEASMSVPTTEQREAVALVH